MTNQFSKVKAVFFVFTTLYLFCDTSLALQSSEAMSTLNSAWKLVKPSYSDVMPSFVPGVLDLLETEKMSDCMEWPGPPKCDSEWRLTGPALWDTQASRQMPDGYGSDKWMELRLINEVSDRVGMLTVLSFFENNPSGWSPAAKEEMKIIKLLMQKLEALQIKIRVEKLSRPELGGVAEKVEEKLSKQQPAAVRAPSPQPRVRERAMTGADRADARERVRPEPKERVRPEPKERVRPEPKERVRPEPKERARPEPKERVVAFQDFWRRAGAFTSCHANRLEIHCQPTSNQFNFGPAVRIATSSNPDSHSCL